MFLPSGELSRSLLHALAFERKHSLKICEMNSNCESTPELVFFFFFFYLQTSLSFGKCSACKSFKFEKINRQTV
jgi:hypothetical protein